MADRIRRDVWSVARQKVYLVLVTLFRPKKGYRLQLGECNESDVYPVNNEFGVAIRLGCPNTVVVR